MEEPLKGMIEELERVFAAAPEDCTLEARRAAVRDTDAIKQRLAELKVEIDAGGGPAAATEAQRAEMISLFKQFKVAQATTQGLGLQLPQEPA